MDGQSEVEGLGGPNVWGFSPSIDLFDALYVDGDASKPLFDEKTWKSLKQDAEASRSSTPPRVLLVSNGDYRHIFHTMSQIRRWQTSLPPPKTPTSPVVEFYVVEPQLEVVARYMLLWLITIDEELSMQARTELLLEVYGNCFLRGKFADRLKNKLFPEMIQFFAKDAGPLKPYFDVDMLKSKERDEMEAIVRHWMNPTPPFNIRVLRDSRLRQFFGSRYDSRANMYDWDLTFRVRNTCAIIHNWHYKRWRESGQAYEVREVDYNVPNVTLATKREALVRDKGKMMLKGFWSDILVSPFIGFGVESLERDHFEVRSKQYVRAVVTVAEAAVTGLLCGLEHGRTHSLPDALRAGGDQRAKLRRKAKEEAKEKEMEKEKEKEKEKEAEKDGESIRAARKTKAAKGEGEEEEEEAPDAVTIASSTSESKLSSTPTSASASASSSDANASPSASSASASASAVGSASAGGSPHYPPSLPRVPFTIKVLPTDGLARLVAKQTFNGSFQRAYVGYAAAILLTSAINPLFQPPAAAASTPAAASDTSSASGDSEATSPSKPLQGSCYLTIETLKYLPLKEEQKAAYLTRVTENLAAAGWLPVPKVRTPAPPAWDAAEAAREGVVRAVCGTAVAHTFGDHQLADGESERFSGDNEEGVVDDGAETKTPESTAASSSSSSSSSSTSSSSFSSADSLDLAQYPESVRRELRHCGHLLSRLPQVLSRRIYASSGVALEEPLADKSADMKSSVTFVYVGQDAASTVSSAAKSTSTPDKVAASVTSTSSPIATPAVHGGGKIFLVEESSSAVSTTSPTSSASAPAVTPAVSAASVAVGAAAIKGYVPASTATQARYSSDALREAAESKRRIAEMRAARLAAKERRITPTSPAVQEANETTTTTTTNTTTTTASSASSSSSASASTSSSDASSASLEAPTSADATRTPSTDAA